MSVVILLLVFVFFAAFLVAARECCLQDRSAPVLAPCDVPDPRDQTAWTDLLDPMTMGLLEKSMKGRAFMFTAPDDLREGLNAIRDQRPTPVLQGHAGHSSGGDHARSRLIPASCDVQRCMALPVTTGAPRPDSRQR